MSEALKILHILDHSLPLHSGYAFRTQSLFEAQQAMGFHPVALTGPKHEQSWKGSRAEIEEIQGFTCYRTGPVSGNGTFPVVPEIRLTRALARRLEQVIERERPAILHAHSPFLNARPALKAARRWGLPIIYEIRAFWEDAAVDHGTCREGSWRYCLVRAMETRVCRLADHVTVLCQGLKDDLAGRGIPERGITIIPNGVHLERFEACERDETLKKRWHLEGKTVIGFIGSFYRYEGLDLLVRAFAKLASRHPDLVLLLVGGGEMEEELKRLHRTLGSASRSAAPAEGKGLGARVLFAGRLPHEQIRGVYGLMDILVYPRYAMRLTELVTPLKPLEAMAMAKPVVASDVGGHRELIEDGVSGILFPPGDSDGLARTLEALLRDPERARRIAVRASMDVAERFTWRHATAPYQAVYESALRHRSGRR